MKSFKTTHDVLDYSRRLHQQLSDYYQHVSDVITEKRLKLLLDYMCRHEQSLVALLDRYAKETSQKILDRWFQYVEMTEDPAPCLTTKIQPNDSIEKVIGIVLETDDCLIKFYRAMAECSQCESVNELFRNLLEMVEQEKHKLTRNALSMHDI